MRRQPFVTSLSANASYALGDPILVTFEIENAANETYQLLKWGTPLERPLTGDCLTVRRDGQVVPYDGKLVKRGDPPIDSYLSIGPNERLQSTVDISEAYAIDSVGDYTVTLKAVPAVPVDGTVVYPNLLTAPAENTMFPLVTGVRPVIPAVGVAVSVIVSDFE